MNETTEPGFLLQARCGGRPPVLAGVEADAHLDGVLLMLTLRQRYRNESAAHLEVVYTFPLPHGAVLLEFAAELGGQRRKGVVQSRAEAEETYESALADGDLPALLETSGDGVHTANIGNLKPGEEAVLEIRTAQWLTFDQGRLRVAIPTTLAPRYGDPARAGLQPHQLPPLSMAARYPLSLTLTLGAALADAAVDCPTHATAFERSYGQTRISLQPGAVPDRDVVFTVTPRSARGGFLQTADDARAGPGHRVAVAAFEMPQGTQRTAVRLRLLVDCSGSMNGDSIASAREALHGVLAGLTGADEAGLSRFGSQVEHACAATPCTPAALRHLGRLIDATTASMGGTELEGALTGVFDTIGPNAPEAAAGAVDVLLITDGEVWDMPDVVRAVQARGHRIFAIGVGSAPAGGALQRLVDATGGTCEFVTPAEDMRDAAARMLRRMRQAAWEGLQVDWGTATTWCAEPPARVFGGDTLVVMAGLAPDAARPNPRLLPGAAGGPAVPLPVAGPALEPRTDDTLARLGASLRLRTLAPDDAQRLAVDHQLLTPQTCCVLVHARAEGERSLAPAQLVRVPSMLAAGWGGQGTVTRAPTGLKFGIESATVFRSARGADGSAFRSALSSRARAYLDQLGAPVGEAPAADIQPARPAARPAAGLHDVMTAVAALLGAGRPLSAVSRCCLRLNPGPELLDLLAATRRAGVADPAAWLLLALWVALRPGDEGDAAAAAVLQAHTGAIAEDVRLAAWAVFDRELANGSGDGLASRRQQRLARALRSDA